LLKDMFLADDFALHLHCGDHLRRCVPMSKREIKVNEGPTPYGGIAGRAASTGRPSYFRANDPLLWKQYQEGVDIKVKRSDIMVLYTYVVRRHQDIVAILQFVCEDNPNQEHPDTFNPDATKHVQALESVMHLIYAQLEILFPEEKLEALRRSRATTKSNA